MKIQLTNRTHASEIKPARPKSERFFACLLLTLLLFGLLTSPAIAKTDWDISPSHPNVGDTLKLTGTASPEEELGADISFKKELPVTEGRYQYLLEEIKIPYGKNNLFTVTGEGVENLDVSVKKLIWINLSSDASGGTATISQGHVPPLTYKVLISGDALSTLSKDSSVKLTVTASQTITADSNGNFEFDYDTSALPAGKYVVTIGNKAKTIELGSGNQNAPGISSISPSKGPSGELVTITGTGFNGATGVYFGEKKARYYTIQSNTKIIVTVPDGSGTLKVRVSSKNGWSNSVSYTYTSPTISSISPSKGPSGELVTITGTGFNGATGVYFGEKKARYYTIQSNTKIIVTVPDGSGTLKVRVSSKNGWSNSVSYTYTSPTISSISPSKGPSGELITITGTGFNGATGVYFGEKKARYYTIQSSTKIIVTVPDGSGTLKVRVSSKNGWSNSVSYTYTSPTIG